MTRSTYLSDICGGLDIGVYEANMASVKNEPTETSLVTRSRAGVMQLPGTYRHLTLLDELDTCYKVCTWHLAHLCLFDRADLSSTLFLQSLWDKTRGCWALGKHSPADGYRSVITIDVSNFPSSEAAPPIGLELISRRFACLISISRGSRRSSR